VSERSRATRRERRHAGVFEPGEERRDARPAPPAHPWVVPVLGAAFFLSGAAGLMHEVVWTRLLGHVFGTSSLAVSTVLAAFMGGLALGSWWIGSRSARLGDQRRAYALLELGVGAFALLVPVLLGAVTPLYGWLWRRFHPSFAAFSVLRFLVAGTILLAPTVLMGATLPVLADYVAQRGRRLAPAWLYTVNLVGAVLGVVAAGFVLMPAIGVWGTIAAAAALNVGVGAAVLALPAVPAEPVPRRLGVPAASRLLLVAAFLSGLVSLVTQVTWTRVLLLVVGSTTHAFSSVLVVYLVALGAGSWWATRRGGRVRTVAPDLAAMHLLAALFMLVAIYSVNRLPGWYLALYGWWSPEASAGVALRAVVTAFAILFLPVFAAGTILPLAMVGVLPPDARGTGPAVGRIYAVNTLGAIAGAVLAGFVLVPLLGTQGTLVGVTLALTAMGLVFALRGPGPRWRAATALAVAVLVVLGVLWRPEWNHGRLQTGVFEAAAQAGMVGVAPEQLDAGLNVLYQREGTTASVMVVQGERLVKALRVDARVNASDEPGDMATQTLVAQIPLLLAPAAHDALVVGWGSGVSVGSVMQWPVEHVTAVELEPAVVEASQHFLHVNHNPLADPRLRLYEDDARHILLASDDTYDVIVSEPSHPWVAGVGNLFTQDFYRLAARRLRPDGVFAQWVQSYEISFDVYRSLLATFQSVFPETLVFVSNQPGTDTILVGSRRPLALDLAQLERRWETPAVRVELARIGMQRPEHLLAALVLGPESVRRVAAGARLNTDDNMYVEFHTIQDTVAAAEDVGAELERHATPIETALPDAAELLASRERLGALVDGLERLGRAPDRYRALLTATSH
jgi:spermidine synthase